jgi:protein-tyrosine phosphatase
MTEDVAEILVVCMGNICRSPLAQVMLEAEATRRLGLNEAVWVRSAGVRGLGGQPATAEIREEASLRGLDLSRHRGAGLAAADLLDPDLVLTMTESQRDATIRLAPVASERVFTLKEFARLVPHIEPPDGLAARDRVLEVARRAHLARARVPGSSDGREDVVDPYGASRQVYADVAEEIEGLVGRIAPALFGGSG